MTYVVLVVCTIRICRPTSYLLLYLHIVTPAEGANNLYWEKYFPFVILFFDLCMHNA